MDLIHDTTRTLSGALASLDIPAVLPIAAGVLLVAALGWRRSLRRRGGGA
jgi:hypothetical protein